MCASASPKQKHAYIHVKKQTYHSSEARRDQSTVDGDKTAADEPLWTEHKVKLQNIPCYVEYIHHLLTWMSSSLESNSDTSTFSPSVTLVREMHSCFEDRVCASEGRLRFRPDLNTLIRLKVGCRGPRFLFLASLATSITSSQHLAGNENTLIKPVSVLSDAIDDNLGVSLGLQVRSVRGDCFIMRKKVKGGL